MQIEKFSGLLIAMLLIGALLPLPARAADEPPVVAVPADDTADTTESDEATDEPPQAADSVGGQMGDVSLDRFVPSEEISADGAVSFPVDI